MNGRKRDWLDWIALRCDSAGVPSAEIAASVEPAEPTDSRLISRGATLKLALAGVASLSLGLWKAPPALAQDRGECFTKCLNSHDKELNRRLASCEDVFLPKEIARTKPRSYERAFGVLARVFGKDVGRVMLGYTLTELCYAQARHEVAGEKSNCYEGCERTCRQRSTQSVSGTNRSTCEVTPPTRGEHPSVPPPPDPPMGENDYCAPGGACDQVGGKCCGPPSGVPGINICLDASLCP